MKQISLLIAAVIIIIGTGCTKDKNQSKVQLRVKNISAYNYTDLIVNTGSGKNNFGDLASNQESNYKEVDYAYRYAYVELKINGETFILRPIDYVGETKLSPKKYTYEINANLAGKNLTLNLVSD